MARIARVGGSTGAQFKARILPARRNAQAKLNLTLPTKPSEPIKEIGQAVTLIYGEPGIGKTSLGHKFPQAITLFFEPGGKGLRLLDRACPDWRHFLGYVDLLVAAPQFKTVVIDTADKAYDRAFDYTAVKEGFTHPNERPWGEGWKAIRSAFAEPIDRLIEAGKGVVFISHAADKEFETRSGRRYHKIIPSMSKQAHDYVAPLVDVIGYYGYWGEERYLTIRGSDEVEAKNRLKYQFRTVGGHRVHSIPMFDPKNPDFDEEDAWRNMSRAFSNLQGDTGEPEEAVTLSNIRAKPKPSERRR